MNKVDELHVFLEYDRDTLGLLGSPDISISIFEKIDKCALFIADISNITSTDKRTIPNPNVLIELGYAINILGWDRIICFFDITTGNVENYLLIFVKNVYYHIIPLKKMKKRESFYSLRKYFGLI